MVQIATLDEPVDVLVPKGTRAVRSFGWKAWACPIPVVTRWATFCGFSRADAYTVECPARRNLCANLLRLKRGKPLAKAKKIIKKVGKAMGGLIR